MKKAFNSEELQKEIERLKSEGRMPSMEQFLRALASAKKQQKKAGDDQPKKDQQ